VSFEVSVTARLDERTVELAFASNARAIAIVGPSGAGKTSVLNMVAGLLRPERGRIVAGGHTLFDADADVDVPAARRRAGYAFQDVRLFPHLRVRANLLYGAPGPGRLREVAALLGLEPLLDRWPRHLSGGEAQRVSIGRALLCDPAFLLLDEPLAHLDRARGAEVLGMIARARDAAQVPVLYVTHRVEEAEVLGAEIVRME
jgi:molybdate transport system ATP-binding protein